ncbi:MAG TPA: 16S rRNA (guanine(966)-N(2))-methyltransferase RsmD [Polyangiaceae bacterium]
MRVIAGSLRSRRLCAPSGQQTRPTHDRVKEALFSMLGNISGKNVADLYAGTGALGIEALSRGALHACFVERARDALACLRRNLQDLGLDESSTVIARSLESAGNEVSQRGPYDLLFCDPPWKSLTEVGVTLNRLRLEQWLTPTGLFILEHPAKFDAATLHLEGLTLEDRRHWGDTGITLFGAGNTPQAMPKELPSTPS